MAVAAPVLERKSETEEEFRDTFMSQREADAIHNALIRQRYARLINPEISLTEVKASQAEEFPVENYTEAKAEPVAVVTEQRTEAPYLVTNARADSDIFRADSAINRRQEVAEAQAVPQNADEEENEDLRPTSTTIQYKTTAVKDSTEEGKIVNVSAHKGISLSKRDKITIAAVITVIVALFVLIIVNSAIISGLNSDLNSVRAALTQAQEAARTANEAVKAQQGVLEQTAKSVIESMGYIG